MRRISLVRLGSKKACKHSEVNVRAIHAEQSVRGGAISKSKQTDRFTLFVQCIHEINVVYPGGDTLNQVGSVSQYIWIYSR